MALDRKAREILFGTPVFARQLRKCIESKGTATEAELWDIFQDVGRYLFHKTLRKLHLQGVVETRDGMIVALQEAPAMRGCQADRAWRAACLLKSFRLDELCRIAEINWTYAQRLVGRWVKSGVAVKTAGSRRGAPAIWSMTAGKSATRPVRNQR